LSISKQHTSAKRHWSCHCPSAGILSRGSQRLYVGKSERLLTGHELATTSPVHAFWRGRHTAEPISRAASRYCPHSRSSNAMATLAWAAQLHHHDFDARPCSTCSTIIKRDIREPAQMRSTLFSFCFATTLDKTSKGGTSSKPAEGASAASAFSHHHFTCP